MGIKWWGFWTVSLRKSQGIIQSWRWFIDILMTRCPALDYENTEVVIMQTDAKTFADKFSYPICNLCGIMPLYSLLYQRLIKFMTSTSLSANEQKKWRQVYLNAIFFAQAGRDVGAQRRNPGEYFAQPSFVARAPPARDVGAQRRNNPYSRRLVALFMYLCHGSRLVR